MIMVMHQTRIQLIGTHPMWYCDDCGNHWSGWRDVLSARCLSYSPKVMLGIIKNGIIRVCANGSKDDGHSHMVRLAFGAIMWRLSLPETELAGDHHVHQRMHKVVRLNNMYIHDAYIGMCKTNYTGCQWLVYSQDEMGKWQMSEGLRWRTTIIVARLYLMISQPLYIIVLHLWWDTCVSQKCPAKCKKVYKLINKGEM